MKFKFKCIKRLRFEKLFSPDSLEITLGFLHIFGFFLNHQNFKFKNHRSLISECTDPAEF
jgi:hypothetical protein